MGKPPSVLGVTVDDPTSQDLDDAIWLEADAGGYMLTVSVTAVSKRVSPGSTIDNIAQQAAFTRYYAQGRTKPMLTRAVEESLSLLPGESRRVLAMTLRYSPVGELLEASDPFLATLDNQGRYSYEQVADLVAGADGPHAAMFRQAAALSEMLLDRRRKAGALVFYDLLRGWETNEEGLFRKTADPEANVGHIIIQEFMVAPCTAMGDFATRKRIDLLFRNHQAGFATPDRDILLSDLAKAISMPVENLRTLHARFMLILERAKVGPWLLGHYGLNVPAYAQWTSPLRRYSDLVNHRQVIAFLEGVPLPYSRAELDAIADVVNTVEEKIRDAAAPKPASLQAAGAGDPASQRFAAREMVRAQLRSLAPDKLYEFIAQAAREGIFPPPLLEELDQRFEAGLLGPRELFALLLVAPPLPELEPLRHRILDQLALVPVPAPSIMSMAAATLSYSVVRFSPKRTGPDHQPVFAVTARVTVPKRGELESDAFRAPTSKAASQRAAVDLIGIVAGYRPQGQSDTAIVQAPVAAVVGGDWKSALNQLCQRRAWGAPQYDETERTGPPHAPLISVSVTVETTDGPRSASGGPVGSKKQAEQLAAQTLYEELSPAAAEEEAASGPFVAPVIQGNYTGALAETCVARHWREPQYSFESRGDVHTCRCVIVADDVPLEAAGRSRQKGEAKRQAARRVYLALLSAA